MDSHKFADTFITVSVIGFVVAVFASGYWASANSCANQANMMGMRHDFGLFQGCMIEHKPGKWIPLKNYRVL